jgi:methylated-DNA-[protein]-cysteine S-methyltransferase
MRTIYTQLPSPLGDLLVVTRGEALAGLYFPEHRRGPVIAGTWERAGAAPALLSDELAAYFAGALLTFSVPLDPTGTPFQHEVWAALRGVGHGATTTYRDLAGTIGRPTAARAVAGAVARNPISVVVPCHRVVGSDGALTGYAGGIERKRHLLELERG